VGTMTTWPTMREISFRPGHDLIQQLCGNGDRNRAGAREFG
jgi:hypothetical protein